MKPSTPLPDASAQKDGPQSIAVAVSGGSEVPRHSAHGDATQIPDNWTFKDQNVADNFDRHVREQLPWYDLATQVVTHFGRHYLPERGMMYDLGSSTGNVTRSLEKEIRSRNVMAVSLDNSAEMVKLWRGVGEVHCCDVTKYEFQEYDFAVCFLLLMFLPPAQQQTFFKHLMSKLKPGGALVVFDKVETADGYLGTVMHRLTIAGKVASGVPSEDIIKKELSLAGVQRPLPHHFMQFTGATCEQIFRYGEFAGWVIIR